MFEQARRPHGTATEAYLDARKLKLPPGDDVIRHPRCVFGGERVPCMVTLFRHNLTNEPVGIQRTRLPPAVGSRHEDGAPELGPTSSGSIKIDDDADVLYGLTIAEGTETALGRANARLSARMGDRRQGHDQALPGAAWPVQSLSIHWERDAADDVRHCLDRWRTAGRETIILRALFGKDAADALWEGP